MAVHPGPYVEAAEAFVTGRGSIPPVLGFRGSHNLTLISDLTKWLNGDKSAGTSLGHSLLDELNGGPGLWSDEFGGGYSGAIWRTVLIAIRHCKNGGVQPSPPILPILLRWHGAALRARALLAVPHNDSIITTGPAARMRDLLAADLQYPLQITLGEPVRRYGISGSSGGRDHVNWFWRGDGKAEQDFRRLVSSPRGWAEESGVDPDELLDWVYRPTMERAQRIANHPNPLKFKWETVVMRWEDSSKFAAYWPEFQSYDAPCAGAVRGRRGLELIQPQPIGPRAGKDTQHWGGDNFHLTSAFNGKLVARFVTLPGVNGPGDQGDSVRERRTEVALPSGRPTVAFSIDNEGFSRLLPGRDEPQQPTGPPPPVVPPRPDPGPSQNERIRQILEKFLQMRRGRVRADEMEAFIRSKIT